MEVVRYWRNQESNYLGQGSNIFDIKRLEGEEGVNYEIKSRLFKRKTGFEVREGKIVSASEQFVEGMERLKYSHEIIFELACKLAASDESLGEGFVVGVAGILAVQLA